MTAEIWQQSNNGNRDDPPKPVREPPAPLPRPPWPETLYGALTGLNFSEQQKGLREILELLTEVGRRENRNDDLAFVSHEHVRTFDDPVDHLENRVT